MVECIFCKIVRGEIPAKRIYENDNFFSIPDANPVVSGHSLIISKKHYETVFDLPKNISNDLIDCIKQTTKQIMKKENAGGFNVINNNFEVAGQVVKHVHFHIIPRKKGDGLKILA